MTRAERLCAVSVDLDEIRHYYAIHGLSPAIGDTSQHAVYERALARFRDFADAEQLPLTLFVVGSDLARPQNGAILRALADRGHELGNHTFDHHYDFSRRDAVAIEEQITRANQALREHTGHSPVGFRAPGYVMSDAVYRALEAARMTYSSSIFPCPYYHAAKLAVILALRVVGKTSSSIVDGPGVLSAPRGPYRVGQPYFRVGDGLLELPIQVTPELRLPFIGTNLTLLGPALARRLTRSLVGQRFINLELHGVDLLDRHDELELLAPHQVDLQITLERKWAALSAVVDELRKAGYAFVRLDEAAQHFHARA